MMADETPLYGIRCNDPGHRVHYNVVYVTSANEPAMRSLAASYRCNEVVVTHDGGQTWARADS